MPLSTLTWAQRTLTSNAGAVTIADTFTNLVAYLATSPSPGWHISVRSSNIGYDPGDGSSVSYIELEFVVNPGDEPFYVLLCGSDSGATTAPVDVVLFSDNSGHNYGYNKGVGQIYVGIAPHGGTFTPANLWVGTSQPYNTTWSRLFRWTEWGTTIDNFWFVDAEEQCLLAIDVGGSIQAFLAGQCVAPLADNAAYQIAGDGTGRTPGLFIFNRTNDAIANNFRSGQSGRFLTGSAANGTWDRDHNCTSHVFDLEDNTSVYNQSAVLLGTVPLVRVQALWGDMDVNGSTAFPWHSGALRDSLGNMAFPPLVLVRTGVLYTENPSRCLGVLRQVYDCENSRARQVFQDALGNDIAYVISGSSTSEISAFALSNS